VAFIAKKFKKGTEKKRAIMKKATAYEKAKATAHKGSILGVQEKKIIEEGMLKVRLRIGKLL